MLYAVSTCPFTYIILLLFGSRQFVARAHMQTLFLINILNCSSLSLFLLAIHTCYSYSLFKIAILNRYILIAILNCYSYSIIIRSFIFSLIWACLCLYLFALCGGFFSQNSRPILKLSFRTNNGSSYICV